MSTPPSSLALEPRCAASPNQDGGCSFSVSLNRFWWSEGWRTCLCWAGSNHPIHPLRGRLLTSNFTCEAVPSALNYIKDGVSDSLTTPSRHCCFPTKSQLPWWILLFSSTKRTSHSQFQFRWWNSWVMCSHSKPYRGLPISIMWPADPLQQSFALWLQKCDNVIDKCGPAEHPYKNVGVEFLCKYSLFSVLTATENTTLRMVVISFQAGISARGP